MMDTKQHIPQVAPGHLDIFRGTGLVHISRAPEDQTFRCLITAEVSVIELATEIPFQIKPVLPCMCLYMYPHKISVKQRAGGQGRSY